MPPDPSKNRPEFYVWGRAGAIVGRRCQRPRFGLHGDFEVAAGSHGGNELVGERHGDEAPDIGAGLDRLPFGGAVVDLDQDRLGEIEAERERDHHRAGLAVGRGPHQRRRHQLPGLAVEDLLDGAAVQRLAVARALDPPRGRRSLGCLLRPRRLRGGDQDGQRHQGGHRLGAFARR
jgi:hypothetical protein